MFAVARRHNLPAQITSFVGRESVIAEAARLLSTTRLVTLTGVGGIGKTRLAQEVAARAVTQFRDGVWLVELAALSDATRVPQAVAMVLGVKEQSDRPLAATLADAIGARQILLVLDNCEHLVEACAALVDTLLRTCPTTRILATSRQPLGIAGETRLRVPPLTLSASADGSAGWSFGVTPVAPSAVTSMADACLAPPTSSEAALLFVERARSVMPSFALTDRNGAAVEEICWRLDGVPLAVELAAARVDVLSPEQIAARLGDRFRLLTGGSRTALPRQRTLRALIDWSHDQLDEPERILLRRLAVFAGGWTLEAAEAVCAGAPSASSTNDGAPLRFPVSGQALAAEDILDLLSGLVTKSLVQTDERAGEVRYGYLESLRQYAAEKLRDAGEDEHLRGRHFNWYLALAERSEPELTGPQQARWLRQLDDEHDNMRAALAWLVKQADAEGGVRVAGALFRFWATRGLFGEGHRWLAELLKHSFRTPTSESAMQARASALRAASRLAVKHGDNDAAHDYLTEALDIARELGDRHGVADGTHGLGCLAQECGDFVTALTHLRDARELFAELGDAQGVTDVSICLGDVSYWLGDWPIARCLLEASVTTYRAHGNRQGIAVGLSILSEVALEQGDLSTARSLAQESLALASEIGHRERVAISLAALAGVAAAQGAYERAMRLAGAALSVREAIGKPSPTFWSARFARWLEPACRALGAEACAAEQAAGWAMAPDEAIELALATPAPTEAPDRATAAGPRGRRDDPLTAREREVAVLVARGFSNRQIAETLVIGHRTAENHVAHICNKLGLSTRTRIATWAVQRGLLGDEPLSPAALALPSV